MLERAQGNQHFRAPLISNGCISCACAEYVSEWMGESWDLHTAAADSDSGLMVTEACRQGSTEPLNIRGLPPVRAKWGGGYITSMLFPCGGVV